MQQEGATRPDRQHAAARWPVPLPPRLRGLLWRLQHLGAGLRETFEQELTERAGFQWLAVAFGAGSLAYFAVPSEPVLWALLLPAIFLGSAAAVRYRRGAAWRLVTVLAVCFAGATAAKLRVSRLETPQIERPVTVDLRGRVVDVDSRTGKRPRIVLDRLQSAAIAPALMPERVRITLGKAQALPLLGESVAVKARLAPIAGPVVPGGYDPHRAAFFAGIGGSGFALGAWKPGTAEPDASADLLVSRTRAAIVARIRAAQPGEEGAIAAALLVGERSGLSEQTNDSLRRSGLYHILSISGLHMMLVAGTALYLLRALLALSPGLALYRPIRKWSAVGALVVVSVYFALSGGGAAPMRAYVMAGIVFLAILLDRSPVSMRNLAISAILVLAIAPEGVLDPSFQMSFAAVAALVAGWEAWRLRERRRLADRSSGAGWGALRLLIRPLAAATLTTLTAGLAIAPFAAYHFHQISPYSLLGNVLGGPLVDFVIMPFGLLSLAAIPLGLEPLPLAVMAAAERLLLWISGAVASLPGSQIVAPPMASAGILLVAAGLLWLCLWRRPWRLLGAPLILAGLCLAPVGANRPDILISPDGKTVAVRDETGALRVSGSRPGSYAVEQIFEAEAGDPAPSGPDLRAGVRCDSAACAFPGPAGLRVAHVLDASAFPEDCRRADLVATPLVAPPDCRAPLVIDAARLKAFGAHAVRLTGTGPDPTFAIETAHRSLPRPWQREP